MEAVWDMRVELTKWWSRDSQVARDSFWLWLSHCLSLPRILLQTPTNRKTKPKPNPKPKPKPNLSLHVSQTVKFLAQSHAPRLRSSPQPRRLRRRQALPRLRHDQTRSLRRSLLHVLRRYLSSQLRTLLSSSIFQLLLRFIISSFFCSFVGHVQQSSAFVL